MKKSTCIHQIPAIVCINVIILFSIFFHGTSLDAFVYLDKYENIKK